MAGSNHRLIWQNIPPFGKTTPCKVGSSSSLMYPTQLTTVFLRRRCILFLEVTRVLMGGQTGASRAARRHCVMLSEFW